MAEESGKKKFVWIAIGLVLLFGPLLLLSDWGLQKVQGYVNENQKEAWAADWQERIATAYSWTGRGPRAAQAYGYAYDLYRGHNDNDHAAQALYAQAVETEDLPPDGKFKALPLYDKLVEDYPTHELGVKAKGAAQRIRLMSRP